jgi:hypothetical protein
LPEDEAMGYEQNPEVNGRPPGASYPCLWRYIVSRWDSPADSAWKVSGRYSATSGGIIRGTGERRSQGVQELVQVMLDRADGSATPGCFAKV